MPDKKKIFLIDFSSPILIEVAQELIKKPDVNILYWTGCKSHFNNAATKKEKFSNIIFHNSMEAIKGVPPLDMDTSGFEPLSEDLIREMLECESIVLTMMVRLDFAQISFLKKKHLYFKYVYYWNGVLQKLSPDAVIFRATPHAGYNFVLYSLAKKYNIKTIIFDTTILPDKMMIIHDYKKSSQKLLNTYNKIKNEQHSTDELSPKSKAYFEKMINLKQDTAQKKSDKLIAENSKSIEVIPSFQKIKKNIKAGTFFTVSKYYLKSILNLTNKPILTIDDEHKEDYGNIYYLRKFKKITDAYKLEYKNLQAEADFSKKYIYFPLHYQPECNTSPMADFFVDQILMIKILSASIPDDWLIYVKEHFWQWNYHNAQPHLFRYNGYYKELASLKNVKIIPMKIPSFKLIKNAQAVATATGTAGWEALLQKKPVIFFGYVWYMYCDGAFKVEDVNSCKEAIKKIAGYTVNPQKILNYLIALDKIAINCNLMPYIQRNSDLPMETAIKNATAGIYNELNIGGI